MKKPDMMKLKCTDNCTVPLEDGTAWPTEVQDSKTNLLIITVPRSLYWRRRIAQGDVAETKAASGSRNESKADATSDAAKNITGKGNK